MLRKITRIFFRTTGILFGLLFLFGLFIFFAAQTFTFQTWLGQKASAYLSSELETLIYIEKIEIKPFTKADFKGVHILDKKNDTLLSGNLLIDISRFNLREQRLNLDKIVLQNVTSKLIKYKGDSSFNYQFLVDYFVAEKQDTTNKGGWDINFGSINLENVAFVYRIEKYVEAPSSTINFDDIWVQNTYGTITNFELIDDTIIAKIDGLRTNEKSGFTLQELSTSASISGSHLRCENLILKTPKTNVRGTIDFTASGWDDYADFINKVHINSQLNDSSFVSFTDIASFAKEIRGLNETVRLSGSVQGTVSDMRLKNFNFAFGNYTKFRGSIHITGLPDINTSYIHFDAKELTTNARDVQQIPNYPFDENKMVQLPVELHRLGTIKYRGKFDGFINDFTTYGSFKTELGKVQTDLSVQVSDKTDDITYHGKIITENFDLGTLIGLNDLNSLSMKAEVKGKGINVKTIKAQFNGQISSLEYNNYLYSNIVLNGDIANKLFNGRVTITDANADLDFDGTVDFKNEMPQMDFISTVNKLNLKELHFTNKQDSGVLSSQILINLSGSNINNLTGHVNFDNTIYKTKTRTFKLSVFDVQMEQNTEDKKIRLSSGYMNATALGRFKIENLQPAFESLLYHYYPTFFQKPATDRIYSDNVNFYVRVKDFKTINELFLKDIMLSPNTILEGHFEAENQQLNLQFNSGKFRYKKMWMNDLVFILNESNNKVIAELSGSAFHLSDSLSLDNFNFSVNSLDKLSGYAVDWDNLKSPSNKGLIKGEISFNKSQLKIYNKELAITLRDTTWSLTSSNEITIEQDGTIDVDPFIVSNKEQKLEVNGIYSEQKDDSLTVALSNIALQQFNPLLKLFSLKLQGIANGKVSLSNRDKIFAFNGFITLDQLKINNTMIGELVVNTMYHNNLKYIALDGYTSLGIKDQFGIATKNISFDGTYDLEKKEESIDINFSAKPANLSLLNIFLIDILTIKKAFVNGSGKIHGTPDNIKIDGKFKLFNSDVKVDYTNVSYNITGDIEIKPDQISFNNLLMRENSSKSASQGTINGNIYHKNFDKIRIDYDINYKNMLVLNTTAKENPLYYGKIYGTGNVKIYGFTDDLHMRIDNTTNKHSKFILPLDGPSEIGENDFIHFVVKDTTTKKKEKEITGLDLSITVHATPEAQMQILIDQKNGDLLNVQGQGVLKLYISSLGKFEMFGDYIITDGDYLFTLENVINKKFDIDAGSSISWSGDPINADINISTSYKQRASVAPLLNDTTGEYKTRTPVDCKLLITEKLFSPKINFAINFPNLDATDKARISSVLSDEIELNRQVFAFLLFRTFVTPQIYNTNMGGVTAGGAAASTGSELLSNRVSEFLNTYFGSFSGISDLQLGVNYRPGVQNSNEAVELALSKQFLDNKITVDGNFGVNNNAGTSNTLIGDVNVDYKLTPDGRFRLKGFNKSNDNTQLAITGGLYTQGIGFFYRLEFETVDELWKRFQARFNENKKSD